MQKFSANELSRMQLTQVGAMQDTCKVQVYSRTFDTYGAPLEVYTDGSAIDCGVLMNTERENWRREMTTERIGATIRLPIATILKTTDRIKVTHRFGVALGVDQVFEIVGEVRRGPSGLQVDVLVVLP